MTDTSFLTGFIAGVCAAGLYGFFVQRLRFARKKMTAFGSPQSVSHKTSRTPAQLLMDYIAGVISYVVWLAILVGVVLAVLWLVARGF